MAEPFKLAFVGKFSFGRPLMDVIRNFFFFVRRRLLQNLDAVDLVC